MKYVPHGIKEKNKVSNLIEFIVFLLVVIIWFRISEYLIGGTTADRFEAYSLSASIVGKCHFCVKAHYDTLKKNGYTVEQLRDIGRIASVINSVAKVLNS